MRVYYSMMRRRRKWKKRKEQGKEGRERERTGGEIG